MSISRSLWQTNHSLARSCLQHAFVQGLRSGSLPRERFAYYVGQDAFFLEARDDELPTPGSVKGTVDKRDYGLAHGDPPYSDFVSANPLS